MIRTKGILFVTIMLLAAAFVSGCAAPNELNIGYQPSTHQIAHMTAMEKGWWAEDLAPFGIEPIFSTIK